jgi:hypothetical protein
LTLRLRARFHHDVDDPVIGFLIRNSHGIHAYGTNTGEQQIEFGAVRSDELLDVSFTFNCWLGVDQYTISLAVHSREGQAYDWLDAALFLRVTSMTLTEGIANLNASVTVCHRTLSTGDEKRESVAVAPNHESVTYG